MHVKTLAITLIHEIRCFDISTECNVLTFIQYSLLDTCWSLRTKPDRHTCFWFKSILLKTDNSYCYIIKDLNCCFKYFMCTEVYGTSLHLIFSALNKSACLVISSKSQKCRNHEKWLKTRTLQELLTLYKEV